MREHAEEGGATEEERVISRYWPASAGEARATHQAETKGASRLVEDTLRRAILELGALRASPPYGRGGSDKVTEAIKALWEAAEEQRAR